MPQVHPSAIVEDSVQLADDVTVGPGCVLRGEVSLGPGCDLRGQVWMEGKTTVGASNTFFPNTTIGTQPQDWRSDPADPTELVIGEGNVFRENVTVHRGTAAGGGVTRIGNRCMLMVGAHVGHDAVLEDQVTLINNTTVAGHCKVESGAWMSGYAGLHQFTTVGRCSFFAAYTGSDRDVPPFSRVSGCHPTIYKGVNVVGLRRLGVDNAVIRSIRQALDEFYPEGELSKLDRDALSAWSARDDLDENLQCLVDFVARSAAHRFGRMRESGRFEAAAARGRE